MEEKMKEGAEEGAGAGLWEGEPARLRVILNCADVFHLYLLFDLLHYTLNMNNQMPASHV